MSSCSYHGETKWYLPRGAVTNCKQILPGGHRLICPKRDTVLIFDEPLALPHTCSLSRMYTTTLAATKGPSSPEIVTQTSSSLTSPGNGEEDVTHLCNCGEVFLGNCQSCNSTLPCDCDEIFKAGHTDSGIYTIKPNTWVGSPFQVYCKMDADGGWTVLQRRLDGSVDFYRNWTDYKQGFGFLDHEFWLGNEKIHSLTNQSDYELRIDLKTSLGFSYYASYDIFRIADEDDVYRLTDIGEFTGNTGFDAMSYHASYGFTTFDRDNDIHNLNCAELNHGGWWYGQCGQSNLNGDYFGSGQKRITWLQLSHEEENAIDHTKMMIRRHIIDITHALFG